jgi:TolB-like protein/Tfp pilus assembly protein PilF
VSPPRFRRELAGAFDPTAAPPPYRIEGEPRPLRPDSVAVLPFENLSDDPENAYFSDGITDDIITSVAHVQGLRVLSRTSSMRYKGTTLTVGQIAGQLGVATVVTGSVRRSGSRVRVMAEVINAATDDHLWTETYDRELEDIFEVQSEIAWKVASAIERELSYTDRQRIEARGTSDPKAYDLYLRARFLWNQRTEASVAESVRYFQRALERDPGFALAHAGLADAYAILGIYGMRDPSEVLEAALEAADAALSIDPRLGEALAVRACVQGIYRWRWGMAEEAFRRAIELSPSYPTALQWYATNLLTPQGRFDEALRQLDSACGLDPASSAISASEAVIHFYSRDLESAIPEFEALAKLHPRFALVFFFLGQCYELVGDFARAVETLQRATELGDDSSETMAALGHAFARADRVPEAEAILTRLQERAAKRYVSPALLAQVLIGLGRLDEALEQLDAAVRLRATDLIWLRVRPVYDPLRESPRFRAIEATLGLAS